jgi:hypothetical protein
VRVESAPCTGCRLPDIAHHLDAVEAIFVFHGDTNSIFGTSCAATLDQAAIGGARKSRAR